MAELQGVMGGRASYGAPFVTRSFGTMFGCTGGLFGPAGFAGMRASLLLRCRTCTAPESCTWKQIGSGSAALSPIIQQNNPLTSGRTKKGPCRLYSISGSLLSSSDEDASSLKSEELGSKIDLNFPRRRLQVSFTCDACGVRSQRLINPHAYSRGTVFVQCAGCEVFHKLVDNLGLIEEIDYRLEMNKNADELGVDGLK